MDLAQRFEIELYSEQEEVDASQVSCLKVRAKLAWKGHRVSSALCSAQVLVARFQRLVRVKTICQKWHLVFFCGEKQRPHGPFVAELIL